MARAWMRSGPRLVLVAGAAAVAVAVSGASACGTADPPSNARARGPVRPTLPLVRRLASGQEPLARHIDWTRGVAVVTYTEDASGRSAARGLDHLESASHYCGDALRRELPALRQRIGDLVTAGTALRNLGCSERPTPRCGGGGMDLSPSTYVLFDRDAAGRLVVTAIVAVSEAAIAPDWVARAWRVIDAHLARFRATPCSPG